MADLRGKSVLVIGGAGFIGSHVVDELLQEDVKQVIVYDNFARGSRENLEEALKDPRTRIFEAGGDILQSDVLSAAVGESQLVVHLAALWLLQCYEYPRAAFDVNIRGTFNVLEACRDHGVERLVYSSSASVYGAGPDYREERGCERPLNIYALAFVPLTAGGADLFSDFGVGEGWSQKYRFGWLSIKTSRHHLSPIFAI